MTSNSRARQGESSQHGFTQRRGLKWEETALDIALRWTVHPDVAAIETLSRPYLRLEASAGCAVTFVAGGEFNKLYKISTDSGAFLMRVALPVEPYYKTATEVATIHSVRSRTDIPVPKIIACNTSNENILEFQWILMDFVSGQQSRTAWRKLPMHKKEGLVKQLAMH